VTLGDLEAGRSIGAARRALTDTFRNAGLDSPELDARVIAGHALGMDHTALVAAADRILTEPEARAIAALAHRRLACEPVARIVGCKEFWGLTLRLNEATLVPRPETETVVEAALAAIDTSGSRDRRLRLADLGTGSGALLLALLSELPQAIGVGTDLSFRALVAARSNAERLGFRGRASFAVADLGVALSGGLDLIVVNPPYIPTGSLAGLAPEVRHDPDLALDGGADGLACYRAIAADARRLLAPGASLVLELGIGQEPAVRALLMAAGPTEIHVRADLAGIPRALSARLP
jgi:release factor glutamine methyltransferase